MWQNGRMKKAVFLDRDGVINQTLLKMGKARAPYTMDEFKFCEGVEQAVLELRRAGFILVLVTNQPDVARGWVDKASVEMINEHVMAALKIDTIKVCYHTEKDQ